MKELPGTFIADIINRLDGTNTRGITLSGSFSRGEAGGLSDVDLQQYVYVEDKDEPRSLSLQFLDDFLVSINITTIEKESASLRRPAKAIWSIPGLTQARILLDKDGSISALHSAAGMVDWRDLQPAADDFASSDLCELAEETHKVLDGLSRENESKVIYATWGLSEGLATVLLVQRGVLIPTENVFIVYAQETAGKDSAWTQHFRLLIGADPPAQGEPAYVGKGKAALALYRDTVAIVQHIIRPEDDVVIQRTLNRIAEAGY